MPDGLKEKAISGIKWSGASMVIMAGLRFVTLAVLTRILLPSEYGLVGMVFIVTGFGQAFADLGLSNALVHRQDINDRCLSSFFWINVITGFLLFIGVILVRPFAVAYFREPQLSVYLLFAAPMFLITPFGHLFSTLLRKELKFRTLSQLEILGVSVYSVSAIVLAFARFGVLSLILGQIIRGLVAVVVRWYIFRKIWLPKFQFSLREIKGDLAFGAYQTGEGIVTYFSSYIDYILIGRFLGAEILGFYALAYQLMTVPLSKINPIFTKVAFPTFSIIQGDNPRIRRWYCKVITFISTLSFPVLAGLCVAAPEYIKLVHGINWAPSIPILQMLCIVGIVMSLANPRGSVLLAKGRADIGFYWSLFTVLVVYISVIIGMNWGIIGVAAARVILTVPCFLIIQTIANWLIGLKWSQYFKAMESPLLCSVIMLAATIPLRMILRGIDMIPLLISIVATGMVTYVVSYYIRDKALFLELKSILGGRSGARVSGFYEQAE